MKSIIILLFVAAIIPCVAHAQQEESEGRKIIRSGFAYQDKLQDSSATLDDVIRFWSNAAYNPEVRKDSDALAIALGCEGVLEIRKGEKHKADSLFRKALPLFKFRSSKASILVAYAEFERGEKKNAEAMRAYDEIVNTMDSIGALWDIRFYRMSGYAPFAYAIDAEFGMEQIAASDPSQKKKAVDLLTKSLDHHPENAIGMMAIVALHRLGAMDNETYKFKVDLLCSRKPELRRTNDLFERKFSEASKSK